ncbi:hypothetical protein HYH02_000804 [Chlamydomonas schloesseri]|uniref:FAD-binding FR-type domain-containing protein n=1 Tax=Chlamydomonas schloesseri TaxID=2026947 RepID=A0A835WVB2_9CHLO|nr:hypothetical protein HYH02_000804 [Chlamydomonas schloesseri]|eukprot:KAG2454978.1 hypothetical protein HYH02_000804 [Chlamydomonas schloesseri]
MAPRTVYHQGELEIQQRAGVRDLAAELQEYIRLAMPMQHAEFYAQQSMFFVGGRDATGQPWASLLMGPPGFVRAPDATHLHIQSYRRLPQDPLLLTPGSHVGGLGIELTTRRRNRVNGTVLEDPVAAAFSAAEAAAAAAAPPVVRLAVDLSFGNCPKYIQVRDVRLRHDHLPPLPSAAGTAGAAATTATTPEAPTPPASSSEAAAQVGVMVRGRGEDLGPAQVAMIAGADTFFIASGYTGSKDRSDKEPMNVVGCDVSHRGGPTGFLRLQADPRGGPAPMLRWAEYAGNNMYQTLGNLATDPRAGLLVIDWATGDTLQLAGTAEIDHDDRSLPGAQRSVRFTVASFIYAAGALPIDTTSAAAAAVGGNAAVQFSPYLPKEAPPPLAPSEVWAGHAGGAGESITAAAARRVPAAPAPAEQVEVVSVRWAAEGIKTFEFTMPKGQLAAATYVAGQYAVFEFPGCYVRPDGAEHFPSTTTNTPSTPPPSDAASAASGRYSGTITRTWTLTSHPTADSAARGTFSITVKRAGAVSGRLHDSLRPGDRLALRAFAGDFTSDLLLKAPSPRPPPSVPSVPAGAGGGGDGGDGGGSGDAALAAGIGLHHPHQYKPAKQHAGEDQEERQQQVFLLLAGGIGITPIWAVLRDLVLRAAAEAEAEAGAAAGARRVADGVGGGGSGGEGGQGGDGGGGGGGERRRRAVVVYSVRHGEEAAFREELRQLAEAADASAGVLDVQVLLVATAAVPGSQPGQAAAAAVEAAAALAARRGGYAEAHGVRLSATLIAAALGPEGLAAVRGGCSAAMACGPAGFMAAAEQALVGDLGLPPDGLHTESFAF